MKSKKSGKTQVQKRYFCLASASHAKDYIHKLFSSSVYILCMTKKCVLLRGCIEKTHTNTQHRAKKKWPKSQMDFVCFTAGSLFIKSNTLCQRVEKVLGQRASEFLSIHKYLYSFFCSLDCEWMLPVEYFVSKQRENVMIKSWECINV